MTVDQILKEASNLPPQEVAELVDRLTLNLHHAIEPTIESAWKQETCRRIAELESGHVQLLSGERVSETIRKIVGR